MRKFAVSLLLLVSTLTFAQQPPAFRPYVAQQIVLFSQPGYQSPESLSTVGASYRVNPRLTLFTNARIRVDQRFHSVNWVQSGSYRFYKGFNFGGAAIWLTTWTTIAGKPTTIQVHAPSASLGYITPKWRFNAYRTFGGQAPRVGNDLWDFQFEYKLTKKLAVLSDVQSYQYKYPNLRPSPRSMTAEVDLGVKWYLR